MTDDGKVVFNDLGDAIKFLDGNIAKICEAAAQLQHHYRELMAQFVAQMKALDEKLDEASALDRRIAALEGRVIHAD